MNIYQNFKKSFLFITVFFLFILCIHARSKATSAVEVLSVGPYQNQIFSERNFTTLVVSICADEDMLYDDETGLLTAQYSLQGMEGEREIEIYVYDQDGNSLIAQHAGLRISGAVSRSAARKSFRIIARAKYDSNHPNFTYDLWGGRNTIDGRDQEISSYSSFMLHAVRKAMDSTGIHNSAGYALARKAGLADASPTTPAALYINGVYQGAYFILPAKNDNAISELYNISRKNDIQVVSVFEEEKTGVQTHPEVLEDYLEFVRFVQNSDMNDPTVITQVEQQLDVDQCLKYYAVNLLLANGDWIDNNLRVWRCQDNGLPYQDGKWRFFLFDLDWIGSFTDLSYTNFVQVTQSDEYYNILPSLLKNPDYRSRFKEIIRQMEQDAFYPESIQEVIEDENARIYDEICYDFQSDAHMSYEMFSVNSDPVPKEEWTSLEDRNALVEDFQAHLLKTPAVIDECVETYLP